MKDPLKNLSESPKIADKAEEIDYEDVFEVFANIGK